jgi:SAM-dependent methyltransferase
VNLPFGRQSRRWRIPLLRRKLSVVPSEALSDPAARATHWDSVYERAGATGVSWYQPEPTLSLALIDQLEIQSSAAVIDIGGGASLLVDRLLARGYSDLTVLDVSAVALDVLRERVRDAKQVRLLIQDVLTWRPTRRYGVWHDRAVFHFLVDAADQARYLRTLREAVEPGGAVIIATFAPEGPRQCSGLPVARHSTTELEAFLEGFTVLHAPHEQHVTPQGVEQPFNWVAARRVQEQGR